MGDVGGGGGGGAVVVVVVCVGMYAYMCVPCVEMIMRLYACVYVRMYLHVL